MSGGTRSRSARPDRAGAALLVGAALALGACAGTAPSSIEPFLPRLGGDAEMLAATDADELRRLDLVATNFVAALVQLPELRPAGTTLQLTAPTSVFGNVLVRALEDAGYGMQRVSADQGSRYVTYSRRFSGEPQSGPLTDFSLAVGSRAALARVRASRREPLPPRP